MKLVDSLQSIFPLAGGSANVSEKYSTLSVEYQATWPTSTTLSAVEDYLRGIPAEDEWSLTGVMGDDPIPISSNIDLSNRSQVLQESQPHLQDRGAFKLVLEIQKGRKGGKINIYSFAYFDEFVKQVGPLGLLKTVSKDALNSERLMLGLLDDTLIFYSCKFFVVPVGEPEPKTTVCLSVELDKSCDFSLQKDHPFPPSIFQVAQRSPNGSCTERAFDSLFALFCLGGIFDSVDVQPNSTRFRLAGFKIIDWEVPNEGFHLDSAETYWKIYEWIYSEPTKVTDKLGLARNILSTYLKPDSLELEQSAYQAIVSGYKVYLKENLSKYLDLRSKIHDELSEISEKATNLIDGYLSDYQKSSITFVSFFITVFVVRFFTAAKGDGIFNREATILTLSFLGVSSLYLIISLIILGKEKKRLGTRYTRLKARFKDLLHEDDIRAILNNDEEYNDEIDFVKSRRFWFTALWISTIAILLTIVLALSTYVTWSDIGGKIAEMFGWAIQFLKNES